MYITGTHRKANNVVNNVHYSIWGNVRHSTQLGSGEGSLRVDRERGPKIRSRIEFTCLVAMTVNGSACLEQCSVCLSRRTELVSCCRVGFSYIKIILA